ncbi:MAG: YggS family pyridoxal phosphate-dependent enzyme [Bacteroidota bacterium]
MSIANNFKCIKETIPSHVSLVVVSKTQSVEHILEAYQCGQRIFGENKVQELTAKQKELPSDIQWHLLGHLQTNKVKYIAPFVSLIHSVDSLKLLKEINAEAIMNNRTIDCLLEFYIASEETKFGLSWEEACDILNSDDFKTLKNIRTCGVMGMASFVDDETIIRREFKTLIEYFSRLKKEFFAQGDHFKEISMGMTSDYLIAIEEGSTMVRIGTAIFGARNYL